jgi:hypothetical protein
MVKKKGKGFSAILEAFDMGDESASFDGKGKPLGCPFIPTLKDFFLRQTIKRNIEFYGVKIFSIEFKPFSLWKMRGIKNTLPPMRIVIAACPNENHN